ncbi:site-2 protease family protein [Desulfonatronospira sp.]|uniref:site-2 protease family protein n=1 Tax=Desulfonatronospira sp. TaxID=1962951 RepID=UPI0025C07B68|nr:site-2 protease family protein [Desulfonatronospira sp.]
MFDISYLVNQVIPMVIPLLLGITLHEVAHGYTAFRFGDPTAKNAGRLSLNPVRHVDPFGTVLLPLLLILMKSPFLIGWAKPVPFNPSYFQDPRKGIFWVSLAGPSANFALAFGFFLVLQSLIIMQPILDAGNSGYLQPVIMVAYFGIFINVILGIFNLFPIPPLDGSKVLATFLPGRMAGQYMQLEKFGFIIIILLLILGVFQAVFGYVIYFINSLLF